MSHVQIEALSKTFGSTKVIQELDLEVQDGEFLVLLGPSGCGKTTTLRCLAGLEEPTAGTISLGRGDGLRPCRASQPLARQAQHRHGASSHTRCGRT